MTSRNEPPAAATASLFPAGFAFLALTASFVMTRLVPRLGSDFPMALRGAALASVLGALLALIAAVPLFVAPSVSTTRDPASRFVRAVLVAPLVVFVLASLWVFPPLPVRVAGLVSLVAVLTIALATAVRAASHCAAARIALTCLLIGQVLELLPSALVVGGGAGFVPHGVRVQAAGGVSEVCAFVGAASGLAWSLRASIRLAGWGRARLFLPAPLLSSFWMWFLAVSKARLSAALAYHVFGTRFDAMHLSGVDRMPAWILVLYSCVPLSLMTAASASLAGVGLDRGASSRRTLGWLLVLVGGFGTVGVDAAVRFVPGLDPMRVACVLLGAVLLGDAAHLERAERSAAAPV